MMKSLKIKVAFNASCLHPQAPGGWARYTINLIQHLKKQFSNEIEVFEFWNKEKKNHTYWEQITLPKLCMTNKVDLLHCPANSGVPLNIHIPAVLTIHDLFSEDDFKWSQSFKSLRGLKSAFRYKLDWKVSLSRADFIITVSQFVENELKNRSIRTPIKTIYEGIDSNIQNTTEYTGFKTKSYLLYIGTSDKRKRVEQLINAYSSLKTTLKLVLVTKNLPPQQNPNIHILTNLSDVQLGQLYSNAFAFITFSEKEGFGLPIVEAMSCGCPILYAGSGALDEVIGDAGIKVNPTTLQGSLDHLNQENNWMVLSQRSKGRSKYFSWDQAAQETFNVYKKILNL